MHANISTRGQPTRNAGSGMASNGARPARQADDSLQVGRRNRETPAAEKVLREIPSAEQTTRTADSPLVICGQRILRPEAVMRQFGYSDCTTFWQAVKRSGCPYIRITKRRAVFREGDLAAWMDARMEGGPVRCPVG